MSFIEEVGGKYTSIFNVQEEPKNIVFEKMKEDIFSRNRGGNKIHTKNRLKFLLLYSLEEGLNYIKDFNGVSIYNHENKTDESMSVLYKILKDDIKVKDEGQFNIFDVSDFFPQEIGQNYYVSEDELAISTEKLPSKIESNHINMFKKIGLNVDDGLAVLRKKLIDGASIGSDELLRFSQEQLINTLEFLSVKQLKYKLGGDELDSIKKILKKIGDEIKQNIKFFPVLENKSTIVFIKIDGYLKQYITKATLKSKNEYFKGRIENTIKAEDVIYIDVLDIEVIPSSWIELKENEGEKTDKARGENKAEIDKLDTKISDKSEYNDRTAAIGRKGELLVKDILIEKFGPERVVDNNINGENKKIDFEILDEDLKNISHKIEVKATVKSTNNSLDKDVKFIMSSNQYRNAQKYGDDTHLIFVTGVEEDKPEFLYMNFDNSWL